MLIWENTIYDPSALLPQRAPFNACGSHCPFPLQFFQLCFSCNAKILIAWHWWCSTHFSNPTSLLIFRPLFPISYWILTTHRLLGLYWPVHFIVIPSFLFSMLPSGNKANILFCETWPNCHPPPCPDRNNVLFFV